MSDTPRTDAVMLRADDIESGGTFDAVHAQVSRQLERELAEVTKQRDAAIEGLEKLASCDWVITLPDRMDAMREIARQTIEIVKNNKL